MIDMELVNKFIRAKQLYFRLSQIRSTVVTTPEEKEAKIKALQEIQKEIEDFLK